MKGQCDHLLGCLSDPTAKPTNNRAECDLPPVVISHKLSCENLNLAGKMTCKTLRLIAVATHKKGQTLLDTLTHRLRLIAA